MQSQPLLGLIGSLLLTVGVFAPILSVPIMGTINYFANGKGDGTLVLILAVVSLILTVRRRYEWLLTTGVASLAMMTFTFINFQLRMSEANANVESEASVAER
jgi:hypothetical protein